MPYTDEELASIEAEFDSISAPIQEMMRSKSTGDTANAIAAIVGRRRSAGMTQALSAIGSIQISNWAIAKATVDLADGAAIGSSIRAVREAWDAEDNAALGPAVLAYVAASFKYFNV